MKLENSLNAHNINKNLLNVKYAVKGPIVERATQIEREIQKGVTKPFARVVRANIGDCHSLGQKPITFIRQVLALAACPQLTNHPDIPDDVKERATEMLRDCVKGSVGAYSPSNGLQVVRNRIADYLAVRDGVPASAEDIHLGSGASDIIKSVLALFVADIDGKPPAIMLPVPQYPLFSATMSELGLRQANYYLDEGNNWALKRSELERSWREASAESHVRAIVVINPGNPTCQVLTRDNIEDIINFAYEHNLFIIADEVYQFNILSKPFHSFKKVMFEMGPPYSGMELASFGTASKGWVAEAGLRAGWAELARLAGAAAAALRIARAAQQCPSVLGQCVLHCLVKPPALGEPSHEKFRREINLIQNTLAERTASAHEALNSISGYYCNPIEGSMFAYPRFEIPQKAQEAASEAGMTPDEFYCLRLLEETGICVVPGSGFGQLPGTFHFRTTILHPKNEFDYMMASFRKFHIKFTRHYS